MKSIALAFLALFAVWSGAAHAQPQSNRAEVMAASHEFDQAQMHKDRAALERFLAPDYRIVFSSGRVSDRAGFIENFLSPTLAISEIRVEEPYYTDLGRDAAIVGGIGIIRGTENGEAFEERFMFADTFVKRDGQWMVAYTQVTPFARPAAAAQ
ncbi:nuclear transport factor 2 family protein [Terricaulis sp.]|uniref:nuclear transport factor 2 family protein n=1 Tax=Terricaulis sp. TaxID=2768686 RepID=UPI003783C2B9